MEFYPKQNENLEPSTGTVLQLSQIQSPRTQTDHRIAIKRLWSKRFMAITIDLYAILFIRKGISMALFKSLKYFLWKIPLEDKYRAVLFFNKMDLLVLISCSFAYFLLSPFISNGHTLGTNLMGIRIVNLKNESSLKIWQCAVRSYALIFETCSLGLFSLISKALGKSSSLADLLSQSKIVDLTQNHYSNQTQGLKKYQSSDSNQEENHLLAG